MTTEESGPVRAASSASDPVVVRARALGRTFTGKGLAVTALSSMDLDVPAGTMTAFVGPDGAGKTTFLRMICGLITPTSGSLTVLGCDAARQAAEIQSRIQCVQKNICGE